tara:strand:+ start:262 stop:981 length:720 start_codon:yes stop_codon:yes gene_type:complete
MNGWHNQLMFKDQTINWLPSDDYELWIKNYKDNTRKEYLQNLGWDKVDSIEYKFNSHGFRTHEFRSQKNIIALGCSFTVGTGLEQKQIWPSLLENYLNIPVYNLGVFGNSLDGCYRLLKHYIKELKPMMVVVCEPPSRFEIKVSDNESTDMFETIFPFHKIAKEYSNWTKDWFGNDFNSEIQREKNLAAIEVLCRSVNIPFYIFPELTAHDAARDFMHNGPISHQKAFEDFIQQTNLSI